MCIVYIVTELLYPLQDGYTPLHHAARGGHTTCVKHLLSTPGVEVNIKDRVSFCPLNVSNTGKGKSILFPLLVLM